MRKEVLLLGVLAFEELLLLWCGRWWMLWCEWGDIAPLLCGRRDMLRLARSRASLVASLVFNIKLIK